MNEIQLANLESGLLPRPTAAAAHRSGAQCGPAFAEAQCRLPTAYTASTSVTAAMPAMTCARVCILPHKGFEACAVFNDKNKQNDVTTF